MPMIAYCGSCGRYVELTAEGACPSGHPRSALRDVRAGSLADAPAVASARGATPASELIADDPSELAGRIIGNAVIYVPATLILAGALWVQWVQFPGTPVVLRMVYSVLSLVATVAGAFFMVRMRRH